MPLRYEASIENDESDVDPGREVIENNARARLQRAANYTRDELNKVLHRVDQVGKSIDVFSMKHLHHRLDTQQL